MPHALATVVHPTDFSELSADAFLHALRIALAGSRLSLVHVADSSERDEADGFPHVRAALAQWRLLKEDDPPATVADRLGIKVAKIGLEPQDPLAALARFLDERPADLVVMATHGRDGLAHVMHGSVAEDLARRAKVTTLFIPPSARGFVDQASGRIRLSRVLVPVDHLPPAAAALGRIYEFVRLLNPEGVTIELLHVGGTGPVIRRVRDRAIVPVLLRTGVVVSEILAAAAELKADLIAMPTAGRHGFLDALRGSTTERVLRHAPCPVLAVPVRQ